jgi:hypothetical protein
MATTKGYGLKTFWNRLLIKLKLRVDWDNPLITPPAFENVKPHAYDNELDGKVLTFCALCGAGPQHAIHVPTNSSRPNSVKVSTRSATP